MTTIHQRAAAPLALVLAFAAGAFATQDGEGRRAPAPAADSAEKTEREDTMQLGAFSISLAVKDLARSRAFYEKLGFEKLGGDPAHNYLILRNGQTVIGLFQGMFEKNCLTFNPGWDQSAQPLAEFDDVRAIQAALQAAEVELTATTDPDGTGPAHITMLDPDGNPVLIDQHVPKPK